MQSAFNFPYYYHGKISIWINLLVALFRTAAKHHACQQSAPTHLQRTQNQPPGLPYLPPRNTKLQHE